MEPRLGDWEDEYSDNVNRDCRDRLCVRSGKHRDLRVGVREPSAGTKTTLGIIKEYFEYQAAGVRLKNDEADFRRSALHKSVNIASRSEHYPGVIQDQVAHKDKSRYHPFCWDW